ncbi:MAG: LysR family transcriptional regulator [Clostridia bacterium]|nr:LysR family transcriptional regulator [Clostridia bacterium]MBR2467388.1 LysR family transcriptional regulator [Clostridia bacterium]
MELIKKYIYEVYKESNFTKAARKLFISQPALSSAVSKYEKSLGFRIFDRSKNPLKVTAEGRILIESIANIINIETLAEQEISLMKREPKNEIVIGAATSVAYYLIPKICAIFHKENPSVSIKIDLGNTTIYGNFFKKVQNGTLDLVIDCIPTWDSLESIVICKESMVVVVPEDMVSERLKRYALTYDELQKVDLSDVVRVKDSSLFEDVSFADFPPTSLIMKSKMKELFGEYHTIPLVVFNHHNSILHHSLAKEGVGAVLVSIGAAKAFFSNSDKVSFFLLDNEKAKREIYLTVADKNLNSPLIKRVVEIAKAVCEDIK